MENFQKFAKALHNHPLHTHTETFTHTHTQTLTHTHTETFTHTQKHSHTHTHTHSFGQCELSVACSPALLWHGSGSGGALGPGYAPH